MAAFEYTALDRDGKTRKGVIESDSLRQARQFLRDREWAPLSVVSAVGQQPRGGAAAAHLTLGWTDLTILTRQLATLLGSGVTLEEALKAIAEQNNASKTARVLLAVRARVL